MSKHFFIIEILTKIYFELVNKNVKFKYIIIYFR